MITGTNKSSIVFYAVTQLLEKWDNFSRTDAFLFFLLSTFVPYNLNRLDLNIQNGGLWCCRGCDCQILLRKIERTSNQIRSETIQFMMILLAVFDSSVLDVGVKFTSWQVSDEPARVLKKSGISGVPRLLLILTIFSERSGRIYWRDQLQKSW